MHQSKTAPYVFLLPAALLVIIIVVYPMIYGVMLAFTDSNLHSFETHFVGLRNFAQFFEDARFLRALRNSVVWSLLTVTLSMLSGFGLALILNREFFGRRFSRGVLLVPWTVPSVAVAFVWIWLYDPLVGIFNQMLQAGGLGRAEFLSDMRLTQLWLAISVVWRFYPFVMLMLLAGLQSIDRELYEAAAVDGASPWQKFRFITMPGISMIFALVTILEFIWLFNHIDMIWIMTGGGPADVSHTLATYSYYVGFKRFEYGYASAIGVLMLVILFVASFIYLHLQERSQGKP
jgi:multiple sugar transport system permease protein